MYSRSSESCSALVEGVGVRVADDRAVRTAERDKQTQQQTNFLEGNLKGMRKTDVNTRNVSKIT